MGTVIVESCKLAAVKLPSAKNNFRRLESVRREMVLPTQTGYTRFKKALCLNSQVFIKCQHGFLHFYIFHRNGVGQGNAINTFCSAGRSVKCPRQLWNLFW